MNKVARIGVIDTSCALSTFMENRAFVDLHVVFSIYRILLTIMILMT